MKILLFGKDGQVGWELQRTLLSLGEIAAVDYPEVDFAEPDSLRTLIRQIKPGLIINAAAYTNVGTAESDAEAAIAVNGTAPGVMAEEAKAMGAALIHYSTDYVFDGKKGAPYNEQDLPNPVNVYGRSKLMGEEAVQQVDGSHLILRTSWVYSLRRKCFVTEVLKWAREKRVLRIVTDQVGSPTWCRTLAEVTAQAAALATRSRDWLDERKGIYHVAGAGHASRYDLARAILERVPRGELNVVEEIQPATSREFDSSVERPAFSALDTSRFSQIFGFEIPDWRRSLRLAMDDGLNQSHE